MASRHGQAALPRTVAKIRKPDMLCSIAVANVKPYTGSQNYTMTKVLESVPLYYIVDQLALQVLLTPQRAVEHC